MRILQPNGKWGQMKMKYVVNRLGMVLLYFLFIAIVASCSPSPKVDSTSPIQILKEIPPKYATGFTTFETSYGYLISVLKPYPGADKPLYYLISEDSIQLTLPDSIAFIKSPVSRMVCTSTSHIPLLTYLGKANTLVGFPNLDYISSVEVRKNIAEGKVTDVGNSMDLNIEELLALSPDLIMIYSMKDLQKADRLKSFGLKTVLNADFMETDPLGRAEWIKVMGYLIGEERAADSVFAQIESNYLTSKALLKEKKDTVTVFSGSLYGDAWFMPGGNNYAAKLLIDAGFDYLWEEDTHTEFIQLGFESVFEKAVDAAFWVSPAPFPDLNALSSSDSRYSGFRALKLGNVFVYDNQIGETGGNIYLEEGYIRPDLILKDLIKIHQPELLPEHKLYFYRQLK